MIRKLLRRSFSSAFQSGIFKTSNAIDCLDKGLPGISLGFQDLLSFGGETVVAAATLTGFFNPASFDPASFFEPVK